MAIGLPPSGIETVSELEESRVGAEEREVDWADERETLRVLVLVVVYILGRMGYIGMVLELLRYDNYQGRGCITRYWGYELRGWVYQGLSRAIRCCLSEPSGVIRGKQQGAQGNHHHGRVHDKGRFLGGSGKWGIYGPLQVRAVRRRWRRRAGAGGT